MWEETSLNETQTTFEYLKQYYWDRDIFCETIQSVMNYNTLLDAFCYGEFNQGQYFAWFKDEDEFYIIHKTSGVIINWYKHLGRTNTCNRDGITLDNLREFFELFKEDLLDWAESNHYKLDE